MDMSPDVSGSTLEYRDCLYYWLTEARERKTPVPQWHTLDPFSSKEAIFPFLSSKVT